MKLLNKEQRPMSELRVTRKTNVKIDTGDGHGWAVSYADLLMVLLSFFVIFFSLSEENPDTVQEQLRAIASGMSGAPVSQVSKNSKADKADSMSDLSEALKIDGIRVVFKDGALFVDLENGVFESGNWEADKVLKSQIDKVIGQLAPFKDKITMTVIGHADQKLMRVRNKYLQDNFDLSSLRALNVLKYVISQGIPPTQASARAASSNDRDARSVTFEIRVKKVEKKPEGVSS